MPKNSSLTSDSASCAIVSDTRKVLLKAGFQASDADLFTERLAELLDDYTAACTVMLKALGLPLNYVGLFTTYRLLTDNFGAACSISYSMLEEVEIAHKLDAIETGAPASPGDSGPDPAMPA